MGAMIAIAPPAESNRETPGDPDDLCSTCCSIASSTRRQSISPTTHDACSPGEFPAGSRQPAEARLGARCDQLVVGADRARAERLDEFVGNHRRERIAAADIPRKLVQERNRIASLRPRTVTWSLCPR